ncbi:SEL1-like repeat protein [Pseudomonas sp. HLT2-19-2]
MKRNSLVAGLKRGCLALLALVMSSGAFAAETGVVQCPGDNFADFVKAFSADATLQPGFIASPVIEQTLVPTGSIPRTVERQLMTLDPGALAVLAPDYVAKSDLDVHIQMPDTVFARDHKGLVLKLFTFKRTDCWQLVRVEDWSLENVMAAGQGELRASPGARALNRGGLYQVLGMRAPSPASSQLFISALASYLDSADQGSATAAFSAAMLSLTGKATRLENPKILQLLTFASTTSALASLALADFYCDEGRYDEIRPCADPERSLAALETSATQRSLIALNRLGIAYADGSLGIHDPQRALACYLTAANKGLKLSRTNADLLIAKGIKADALNVCLSHDRSAEAKPKVLSCPSPEFTPFLADYIESPAIQKAFTRVPLKKLTLVDAEPEPAQLTTLLDITEMVFPLIPNANHRERQGLTLQVMDQSDTSATVKLQKPDTGYQVIYRFSFDGCWALDEVQDFSI